MWYEPCLVPDVLKDKDVLGGIWAKAVDPSGEVTSGGSQAATSLSGKRSGHKIERFLWDLSCSQSPDFDMSALSGRLESRMSSDLSRILQLLQQPQGHSSYILGAPASSDLALFPKASVTRSPEPRLLVGHTPSAQVRDEGIRRVSLKAASSFSHPPLVRLWQD